MPVTDSIREARAVLVLNGTAYAAATGSGGIWVALLTALPGVNDGTFATEIEAPAANGYNRPSLGTPQSTGTDGQYRNASLLSFGTALTDWGTATHFALVNSVDAAGSSSVTLGFGTLDAERPCNTGALVTIAAQTLIWTDT